MFALSVLPEAIRVRCANCVLSPQHHRRLLPRGPPHSTAPPPRTAMASSSTYLMVASARAPLALLVTPPLMALVARTAAASVTSGARASAPLFVNAAACRRPRVRRRGWAQICRGSSLQGPPGADSPAQEQEDTKKSEAVSAAAARIAGGSGGRFSDCTTSVLIFGIWAGLMYYVFLLAPNQTPVRGQLPACLLCVMLLWM